MSLELGGPGPGEGPTASVPVPSGADSRAMPQDKHALLDITPSAVERLNYMQYYPVVVFCEPESRQGIKAMRQWLAPNSRKSSRRLYAQASKMKKYCSHLFTATVSLSGSGNAWYEAIKDIVRTQQSQPVWTAAEQVRGTGSPWQGSACWGCSQAGEGAMHPSPPHLGSQVSVIPTPQADVALKDSLDLLNPPSAAASGYLTCDSRANSDYDDTDGEAGAYTDGEAEDAYNQPGLARSSEPVQVSPGHGLSEQVGPPILVQGAGGVAQCPAMGANSYPLWHRQGVTSSCCRVQLCIPAQLWFPPGEHSPAPGWGTNPAPTSDPPPSLWSFAGDRAAAAGPALRQHQVPCAPEPALAVKAASPGAGEGPAEPLVPALPGLTLPSRGLSLPPVLTGWQRHHRSLSSPREYERDAVKKRFTRARDDSDQDEGYEWGPATDV